MPLPVPGSLPKSVDSTDIRLPFSEPCRTISLKGGAHMYTIDRQKFGAFVGALRREKGMTQRELAAALFLSDKAVSKWETGVSHN